LVDVFSGIDLAKEKLTRQYKLAFRTYVEGMLARILSLNRYADSPEPETKLVDNFVRFPTPGRVRRSFVLNLGLGVDLALARNCDDGRHKPQVSGSLLLAAPLSIGDERPVFTTRTSGPKANYTWHVGTELPLNHGSLLEGRSFGRVTNRTPVSAFNALQRVVTPRLGGHRFTVRSRLQSRQGVLPILVRKWNRDHHQDQRNRCNTQNLNGSEAFSLTCSHSVSHLFSLQSAHKTAIWGHFCYGRLVD
jgi:hypothetical protein